ncbi:hypothetical protein EYC80_000813 [Monilinia laxa]|uniref:Uncharacterized protein n=1 Tax=Monilinia laxa TaxID=61186 RepID=A0A5N6K7D1_MONLA|nr:hypothetical protein EYC80_000813 [Monilinia laxa]
MSSNNPHSISSLQHEQTNQAYYPAIYNRRTLESERDYRPTNSTDNAQRGSRGNSANNGQISNYAMVREQGFHGMKTFMESHGLRLWHDEDVQKAHQIIDKMRELDEQHEDCAPLDEQSVDEDFHGRGFEEEMGNEISVGNTYRNSGDENGGIGMGGFGLAAQQQEVSHGERCFIPDELEGDDVGGGCEGFWDREEHFDTSGVDRDEGYNDFAFSGCEDDGHDGNGYDYDDNDCDGYDYDDNDCDGYDYDGDYDSYYD